MSVRSKGLRGLAITAALLAGLMTIGVPGIAVATEGEVSPPTSDALPTPEGSPTVAPEGSEDAPQGEATAPPTDPEADAAAASDMVDTNAAPDTVITVNVRYPAGTTAQTKATTQLMVRATGTSNWQYGGTEGQPAGTFTTSVTPGLYDVAVQVSSDLTPWRFQTDNTDAGLVLTNEILRTNVGIVGETVDATTSNPELDIYFSEPGTGGMTIFLNPALGAPGVLGESAVQAVPADAAMGEAVTMVRTGTIGRGIIYERTLIPGDYYVSMMLNGNLHWYDPATGLTVTDRSKVEPVTVQMFEGTVIDPDTSNPIAPNASSLTDSNRGGVQAPDSAATGSTVSVLVGTGRAGEKINLFLFSTPTSLGQAVVDANGKVSVKLPAGVTGKHRIAVTSASSGALLGWDDILIGSNVLANTGSASIAMSAAAGAALLLAGAATILASRRRATVTSAR